MAYLLELLGRGLIAHLTGAFEAVLGLRANQNLEDLRRQVERDPADLAAAVRLGGRYLQAQEPSAAQQMFETVIGRDPKNLGAQIGLACALDTMGRTDAAIEPLRVAQKLDPISPAILFCLGYCHERLGQETGAVTYYNNAIQVCPTLRNAHERLAAIALKSDHTNQAIEHYTRLCELDPHQADLQLTLGNLLLKAGDYPAAIQRFEQALALEPDNWTAHNDAASAYVEAGLIREAIEHLHKSLDGQPEAADTRLRLGDLYARVGNDEAATSQYQRAVQISPEYLEANVKLGTQHLRGGRFTDASTCFASALELNDRLLSAYVGIGVAQHAAGQTARALASFEMARNVEPNSTLLFAEVARMQLKASAAQQADKVFGLAPPSAPEDGIADLISEQIDRLKGAVGAHPNHADLHYRLGLLYRNRGQIDDAIAEFREAVTINPAYMKALIKLGLALRDADRADEAISVFRQAMDIQPDYLDLHYQLGLLFAQRHQFEMAVEHFERAAQGNPARVSFQANLALALQNMGLVDRAAATWQIVEDIAPASPEAAQARAELAKHRANK